MQLRWINISPSVTRNMVEAYFSLGDTISYLECTIGEIKKDCKLPLTVKFLT